MRVVLDTNVLISALAFPGSKPDQILYRIRRGEMALHPTERLTVVTANDDDNRILECALAARAEFLVTGDAQHLLPLGSYRDTKIVTPSQFLDLLRPQ